MTLKEHAKQALQNFESISSDDFLNIIKQIRTSLKSNLTQEYLAGKVSDIEKTNSEEEKKNLCKKLKPYLDWYISGQ